MEYEGRAMSDKIPQTEDEIAAAIVADCAVVGWQAKRVTAFVRHWREAWLRDAEPRLRPVTETPEDGDTVLVIYNGNSFNIFLEWRLSPRALPDTPGCTGWYLIKRAAVPLTHTEALRLLVSDIRSLGSPPEQLLVALAKAEEALGG